MKIIIMKIIKVVFSQISTNARGAYALVTTAWPYASTLTEDSLAPVRPDTWAMASPAMVNITWCEMRCIQNIFGKGCFSFTQI